jgi:tRNA-binding EMAP/Myf-like protein
MLQKYLKEHDIELEELVVNGKSKGEVLGSFYSKANELLELESLTKYPFPGAISAKIVSIENHPNNEKLKIVMLQTSQDTCASLVNVITQGNGIEKDDIVAFVPVGEHFQKNQIQMSVKSGVESHGIILSQKDLGINSTDQIFVFPAEIIPGMQLTEIGRKENVPVDRTVMDLINERKSEVSQVLHKLESGDLKTTQLWGKTKEWSLQDFKDIYRWLDCNFDKDFFPIYNLNKSVYVSNNNNNISETNNLISSDFNGVLIIGFILFFLHSL